MFAGGRTRGGQRHTGGRLSSLTDSAVERGPLAVLPFPLAQSAALGDGLHATTATKQLWGKGREAPRSRPEPSHHELALGQMLKPPASRLLVKERLKVPTV